MKAFGILPSIEKRSRLEEFVQLIGEEYYRRVDLYGLTDSSDINNVAKHKLIKVDIKLDNARSGDYCIIVYTFEDGTTFDEGRFYQDTDNGLASVTIGSTNYTSTVASTPFADKYINAVDGVQYVMGKIEENQNRIRSEQTSLKLQKIHFALQGQSNGIRVIINISDLPEQYITTSFFVNMQIDSDKDIILNGLIDNLICSLDGNMYPTSLNFLNQRRNYPRNIIRNSIADFDVAIIPENPYVIDGFIISIYMIKSMILSSIEDIEKDKISKVKEQILNLFQFQFRIGSISLTIPLDEVVIRMDE
jgi:hypothetical protein